MNYSRIYEALIARAQARVPPEGYIERHHIVPLCMGGGDNCENIVELTASEHFVAHQLLVKIHPSNNLLTYALNMMSNFKRYGNKKYSWVKKKWRTDRKLITPPMLNKKHSAETKSKMSRSMIGNLNGKNLKGVPKSETHKQNLSLAKKNVPNPKNTAYQKSNISICLECGMVSQTLAIWRHQKYKGHKGVAKC